MTFVYLLLVRFFLITVYFQFYFDDHLLGYSDQKNKINFRSKNLAIINTLLLVLVTSIYNFYLLSYFSQLSVGSSRNGQFSSRDAQLHVSKSSNGNEQGESVAGVSSSQWSTTAGLFTSAIHCADDEQLQSVAASGSKEQEPKFWGSEIVSSHWKKEK